MLERLYHLENIPFVVQYVEPKNADLRPINNDENFAIARKISWPILRILLQRKGESYGELYGYNSNKSGHKKPASALRSFNGSVKGKPAETIRIKDDFHLVSSIVDVHAVPLTMRRVRLIRHMNKQFGLYIRTGFSLYHTANGYERVPAFFVSRMDEDGIAASTGLLSVDDEIIEVNGIEVLGKTIDQVNDMMVANSHNLIITVRPANQSNCLLNQPNSTPNRRPISTPGSLETDIRSRNSGSQFQPPMQSATPVNGSGDGRTVDRQYRDEGSRTPVPAGRYEQYEDESDEEIITGMITL